MVMHKNRNGQYVICYNCKIGNHDECYSGEYIHCHCSCQPACERPACQRTPFHTPSKGWAWDDPRWEV